MWAWKDTLDFGYEMDGSLNLMPHDHREDALHQVGRCGRSGRAGAPLMTAFLLRRRALALRDRCWRC